MANQTQVITPGYVLDDKPTVYINPGSETPFAVVRLGPQLDLFMHEPEHAQALADVFAKTAANLAAAQAQHAFSAPEPEPGLPARDRCTICGRPASAHEARS